jgi:tetratricopeptide (TPR) repeat protein
MTQTPKLGAAPVEGATRAREPQRRATIGLAMIVKNEAHVLERCLRSVRPFLDHWTIVDTGSTDGTQALARRVLRDVPGAVHERPWRDFGHNRSEALALAAAHADYLLVVDADDVLEALPDFCMPPLSADAYTLRVADMGTAYDRMHLFRAELGWRYEGVLHEYPVCTAREPRSERLEGLVYRRIHDGARWRDPEKYRKDAAVLERALGENPTNARYAFYLAQSWRDAGEPARALDAYERRAAMGGWDEEVYVALLEAAKLRELLGRPHGEVLAGYLRAHVARPRRAEALCHLARYCRGRGEHAAAWVFARSAVEVPRPNDVLFVEEEVYAWRALDEYAIAAYWVGRLRESLDASRQLLIGGRLPTLQEDRVRENLGFAEQALDPMR